jgi:hypothetical protein
LEVGEQYCRFDIRGAAGAVPDSEPFPGCPSHTEVAIRSATLAAPTLHVEIAVQNLAYDKAVGVVFTTNHWGTVQTAYGTYRSTLASGAERWQVAATVGPAATVEFAAFYRAAGREYWDNNHGRNYTATPSEPR